MTKLKQQVLDYISIRNKLKKWKRYKKYIEEFIQGNERGSPKCERGSPKCERAIPVIRTQLKM